MMSDITLQQLVYFFTAAECLNFSKAAERLYVAQPAFSKWIAKMEASLGVKLFNRVYHGVELTEAGNYLYNSCQPLAEQLFDAISYTQATWGSEKQRLSVGCINLDRNSPALLEKFYLYKSKYPSVGLSIDVLEISQVRRSFQNHVYDVCIAPSFLFDGLQGIATKALFERPLYINLSVDHPLANKPDLSVADLKEETFCLAMPTGHGQAINKRIYDLCQRYGFVPKQVQYSKDFPTREAAIQLGCISIGDSRFSSDRIRSIPTNEPSEVTVIAWYSDNPSKKVLDFIGLFDAEN